jgi:hypothetical protein
MNFQSDSQRHFALVFDFSALFVDNLNWNSCRSEMHYLDFGLFLITYVNMYWWYSI